MWDVVKDADRFYYECWVHIVSFPGDFGGLVGFVVHHPRYNFPTNWQHAWTNSVSFHNDGAVNWGVHGRPAKEVARWTPGAELVCFLRVELDFENRKGFVWMNGELCNGDLPISPKEFEPDDFDGKTFKLERWGLAGPGSGDLIDYHPRYMDIDDLEFGTWDYGPSDTQPAPEPSSP